MTRLQRDVLETSTTSISHVRQELIDRGLIEPAGYGELRFTVPGFAAHQREKQRRERADNSGQADPFRPGSGHERT